MKKTLNLRDEIALRILPALVAMPFDADVPMDDASIAQADIEFAYIYADEFMRAAGLEGVE